MLLSFSTKNYKSFVGETTFSMTKAPKQKGLDYSVIQKKINKKRIEGLCSSVIYGPNAAGKTNIIGAMDVLRAIVLRGNIRNGEDTSTPNSAASSLELIPNNKATVRTPVDFSISFVEDDMLVEYALSLDLGFFLEEDYDRKIISESLTINNEPIFTRSDRLTIHNLPFLLSKSSNTQTMFNDLLPDIAQNSLNPEELFLTNGFKLLFPSKATKTIFDWFSDKFMVIYRADSLQLIKRFSEPQRKMVYVEQLTNKAAHVFGVNSNAIGYATGEDETEAKLYSIFENLFSSKNTAVAAELFESYGTIRFINIFPLIVRAIQTGSILIVDEFDASVHPMALMSIINIFHNDEINLHGAQLVFNTHNPIFLNSNLLRRDEIKFVERDDNSDSSELYSLADFGTTGDKGVRKNEDYLKNYFVSRYGAIKDIDFTPIFEELIASETEVE